MLSTSPLIGDAKGMAALNLDPGRGAKVEPRLKKMYYDWKQQHKGGPADAAPSNGAPALAAAAPSATASAAAQPAEPAAEPLKKTLSKLNPNAKPFSFNPNASSFVPGKLPGASSTASTAAPERTASTSSSTSVPVAVGCLFSLVRRLVSPPKYYYSPNRPPRTHHYLWIPKPLSPSGASWSPVVTRPPTKHGGRHAHGALPCVANGCCSAPRGGPLLSAGRAGLPRSGSLRIPDNALRCWAWHGGTWRHGVHAAWRRNDGWEPRAAHDVHADDGAA